MSRTYTALVDQSVKVEDTQADSVIAYSAEEDVSLRRALILPGYIKRDIKRRAEQLCKSRKRAYLKMFSAAVFLLFRDPVEKGIFRKIVIDDEYPGNENLIRSNLINLLLHNAGFAKKEIPEIVFDTVHDYQDPLEAHNYANAVRRGSEEPDVEYPLDVWKETVLPSR